MEQGQVIYTITTVPSSNPECSGSQHTISIQHPLPNILNPRRSQEGLAHPSSNSQDTLRVEHLVVDPQTLTGSTNGNQFRPAPWPWPMTTIKQDEETLSRSGVPFGRAVWSDQVKHRTAEVGTQTDVVEVNKCSTLNMFEIVVLKVDEDTLLVNNDVREVANSLDLTQETEMAVVPQLDPLAADGSSENKTETLTVPLVMPSPVKTCPHNTKIILVPIPLSENQGILIEFPLQMEGEPGLSQDQSSALSNSCGEQSLKHIGKSSTQHQSTVEAQAMKNKTMGSYVVPSSSSVKLLDSSSKADVNFYKKYQRGDKVKKINVQKQLYAVHHLFAAGKTYSRVHRSQASKVRIGSESRENGLSLLSHSTESKTFADQKNGEKNNSKSEESKESLETAIMLETGANTTDGLEQLGVVKAVSPVHVLGMNQNKLSDSRVTVQKNANDLLSRESHLDVDQLHLPSVTQDITCQSICEPGRLSTSQNCLDSEDDSCDIPASSCSISSNGRCIDCGEFCPLFEQASSPFFEQALSPIDEKKREDLTLRCLICSTQLRSKSALSIHLANHINVKRYFCNICCSEFFNKSSLKQHLDMNHDKITSDLVCIPCNVTFQSTRKLANHITKIHCPNVEDENEATVACVQCDQRFDCQSFLIIHLQNHTEKDIQLNREERMLKTKKSSSLCSVCGKIFLNSYSMSVHQKAHEGIKRKYFSCKSCGLTFKSNDELQEHKQVTTHSYTCSICNSTLRSKSGLHYHMQNHTLGCSFKCFICSKMFLRKARLKHHMITHTGETPFKCTFCSREFSGNWNRIQHERLHTGEKRYKCEVCGKAFTHNVSKKNHMKYHKNEAVPESVVLNDNLVKDDAST